MGMLKEFWITNISKQNVVLSDLCVTIKSFTSVNLLDKKHYQYSEKQLIESHTKGSLFKKRDKIILRQAPPEQQKNLVLVTKNANIPSREKSIYTIKEEYYEELQVSDEEFAKENADIAALDADKQVIKKDS